MRIKELLPPSERIALIKARIESLKVNKGNLTQRNLDYEWEAAYDALARAQRDLAREVQN